MFAHTEPKRVNRKRARERERNERKIKAAKFETNNVEKKCVFFSRFYTNRFQTIILVQACTQIVFFCVLAATLFITLKKKKKLVTQCLMCSHGKNCGANKIMSSNNWDEGKILRRLDEMKIELTKINAENFVFICNLIYEFEKGTEKKTL